MTPKDYNQENTITTYITKRWPLKLKATKLPSLPAQDDEKYHMSSSPTHTQQIPAFILDTPVILIEI